MDSKEFLQRFFRTSEFTSDNSQTTPRSYIGERFKVSIFANSANRSHMRLTLGRLRNLIATALNNKTKVPLLPKYIIMVIENDIIRCVKFTKPGISDIFGHVLKWLADEIAIAVKIWKQDMPVRARKNLFPQIFWVALPYHQNFRMSGVTRHKFNQSLDIVLNLHENMKMMKIRRIWSNADSSVTTAEVITENGMHKYWRGIDEALEFWENGRKKSPHAVGSGRKFIRFLHEQHQRFEHGDGPPYKRMRNHKMGYNKFYWQNNNVDRQRKLPKLRS